MRLRKRRNADQLVANSNLSVDKIILAPNDILEIGAGRGEMLIQMARETPGIMHYGIEREASVIYSAIRRSNELGVTNIRFVHGNAQDISNIVYNRCNTLWIAFPDPWPKRRHTRRRLTHIDYLRRYRQILTPGGSLHFKTDDVRLFLYTLTQLRAARGYIRWWDVDLQDHLREDINIMSNYEIRWRSAGKKIYYLEIGFTHWWDPKWWSGRKIRLIKSMINMQ